MTEPLYIRNLRSLSTSKTTALNEALAYIDSLTSPVTVYATIPELRLSDLQSGDNERSSR